MNNTDKLLRAFIDAMGYEVKEIDINPRKHDRYPSEHIVDYKVTKKEVMTEKERRIAEQQRELMANRY